MGPRHATLLLAGLIAGAAALNAGCAETTGAQRTSDVGYAARHKLAHELVSRGDWARAFAMLEELHRDRPDDADVLTLRGIVYRERGLFADAEGDLKAALKIAPDSADAHAAIGILYDVQMRPEAEAEHRKAVKLAPKNAAYLNNLGFSLYLRQHFKEAITVYESAARLAPLSRRVRTNLGFACAAVGDLRRAAREFQMGGTEAEAKNNLGFAYERRGDMANAYDLYVEALRLDPKGERARSNLVHAALVLGRPVPPEAAAPPAGQPPEAAKTVPVPVPSDAPKQEAHP
jgi:Flp pilus assembly protein TadD